MSERDELQARLEARGVEFDRRLGVDKLRQLDAQTSVDPEDDGSDDEPGAEETPEPGETINLGPSRAAPLEDGVWPRRVAPLVWVDRAGRRHTDLGAARRADDELR